MTLYLMPDRPCQKVRAFGNVLRYEYDNIGEDRLFEIVKTDLPGRCTGAEEALQRWESSKQP
jgi:hypothetical protein